jgi:hypothetical protein
MLGQVVVVCVRLRSVAGDAFHRIRTIYQQSLSTLYATRPSSGAPERFILRTRYPAGWASLTVMTRSVGASTDVSGDVSVATVALAACSCPAACYPS